MKRAMHQYVNLIVKVFEECPKTLFPRGGGGGYQMQVNDVQVGKTNFGWLWIGGREIQSFDFFIEVINE